MNLYPGKTVRTAFGISVYKLVKPFSDFWLAELQNDIIQRSLLTDSLIPVLKEGNTAEAILPISNRLSYNGIYKLIKEVPAGKDNYTWRVKNTTTGEECYIHETWLWPVLKLPTIPDSCTCNITDLMRYGCKCGQIQRERNEYNPTP